MQNHLTNLLEKVKEDIVERLKSWVINPILALLGIEHMWEIFKECIYKAQWHSLLFSILCISWFVGYSFWKYKTLVKKIELKEERIAFSLSLKSIMSEHRISQNGFYRWYINKDMPIYAAIFSCLNESKIVSPYVIQCFEEGKIPFLPLGHVGGYHYNEARGFIVSNLLNMEPSYFV